MLNTPICELTLGDVLSCLRVVAVLWTLGLLVYTLLSEVFS